jgi:hypothetical protein
MKSAAGLWIDHRQARIVMLSGGEEKSEHILSDIEQNVRFAGGSRSDVPGTSQEEDQQDRRFGNQLNQYYDQVIAVVREADAILIFGPGEAKGELQQRLEREELGGRIVGVKTVDKLTDRQIAAKIRQHFGKTRSQKTAREPRR